MGVRDSDWKDGFLFIGNQPALDFLNTCPVQDGQPVEMIPDFTALLRWFQAAGVLAPGTAESLLRRWGKSASARRTVERMRELRERLRNEVFTWERDGKLRQTTASELNRLMSDHPMLTRLRTRPTACLELWFEPRGPQDLFAAVARWAAELFTRADHTRVRKCGNCVLHFYDSSKKGARRWCSMQMCGNRVKVAAYAARQRRRAKG